MLPLAPQSRSSLLVELRAAPFPVRARKRPAVAVDTGPEGEADEAVPGHRRTARVGALLASRRSTSHPSPTSVRGASQYKAPLASFARQPVAGATECDNRRMVARMGNLCPAESGDCSLPEWRDANRIDWFATFSLRRRMRRSPPLFPGDASQTECWRSGIRRPASPAQATGHWH